MSVANKHYSFLLDSLYILLGIFFCAFGIKSFMEPNHFVDGGVTGISLLLHHKFSWNLSLLMIATNLPFIIMGWFQVNKGFAIKTTLAVIGLAIALQYEGFPLITDDKLLIAVFGGFFIGLGIGLAIRGGCSLDGMEILALYTLKRTGFTITELILGMNVVIFLSTMALLGNIEVGLYAMLTYFIATKTIDFVIEGLEAYTGVTIISGKSEQIKQELVLRLGRGLTVYKGERGFMKSNFDVKHDCDIIFTIITRLEVRRMKAIIHEIDPMAFVFTHPIKEAVGGILKKRNGDH
ncbi:MAG: YitT family protein [Flavipsychrobacter sp.]|nr:YitT family protein [Flavipsychrobacter sp.]